MLGSIVAATTVVFSRPISMAISSIQLKESGEYTCLSRGHNFSPAKWSSSGLLFRYFLCSRSVLNQHIQHHYGLHLYCLPLSALWTLEIGVFSAVTVNSFDIFPVPECIEAVFPPVLARFVGPLSR